MIALNVEQDQTFVSDRQYLAYPLDTLRTFLVKDAADKHKYAAETLDCDDFARILVGREREWFSKHALGNYGSTFGTVWGDIRRNESDTEPYYHAMNVFIDNDHNVVLVEPQNDEIWEITNASTFYMVNV